MSGLQQACGHRRIKDPWFQEDDGEIFFVCADCGFQYVTLGIDEVIDRSHHHQKPR